MRRLVALLAVVLLAIGAGCVTAPPPAEWVGPTTSGDPPDLDPEPTANPPSDPPTDRLGWEAGYWHNETLSVTAADGLTRAELEAVVARGTARVEAIRGLEFDREVPVRIIDRETFREESDNRSSPTTDQRLHQDVKFEALFFLGENESAVSQQEANRASGVLGYYDPGTHNITIVSDSGPPLQLDEVTLAQELFHAVQEEHFAVSNHSAATEEERNARLGIVEGDGNYVDHRYEQRYAGAMVMPERSGGGGSSGDRHIGLFALRYQPYSDGPPFVAGIQERSGWAGVNAVYDAPPESSEQTIHPEKYRRDSPRPVHVPDRSGPGWSVPDQGEGNVDYAEFGEAGLYAMLWYPSFAATERRGTVTDVVIPYRHFFQGGGSPDVYNYSHPASAGWEGDRLLPYVRADSASTNETGYVWRIEWESTAEAREFVDAYETLLSHHGAAPLGESTYRIEDGPFADAFRVRTDGSRVTIVNAPTVEDLDAVHAPA